MEKALRRAERQGFRVLAPRAHWGILLCPGTPEDHCKSFPIYGTPKNPDNHARDLDKFVEHCRHK
ncbi:MAG TPA: hypothetical protein VNB64_08415 [Solirubrobacteraceae bacterium]|nr:hypothetical protein [Solirubrobacteraceae bacterium]